MSLRRLFFPLLFFKAFAMAGIIVFAGIGLGPDEAQYWTWSRQLNVGYYSKPPGIAWQIFLSTKLAGQTELGVRLSAIVLGTLFAYSVYRLGKKSGCSQEASVLAGLMAAFTPLGIFSTFLAITDGGLLVFWTLGLTELTSAMHENRPPSFLRFGLWVALGALFKWPIYLLWIVAFGFLCYYRTWTSKQVLWGIGISLLGLLPSLIWNMEHDFATFRHVFTTVQGGHNATAIGNPLEFLGSQAALVSPIIFILGIASLFFLRKIDAPVAFLGVVFASILGAYLGYSFFKKGQGNWCLFAYPACFVLIGAFFAHKKTWIFAGLGLSLVLTAGAFMIPLAQKNDWLTIPWKVNPFRHNLGWERLKNALPKGEDSFLFGDKYQTTSILSFYSPGQEQAYFFNLLGSRKNQFSYWKGPEKGKDGLFVAIEKNDPSLESFYMEALAPYFESIGIPERLVLFEANQKPVKEALIIPCRHFLGILPADTEKY